MQAFTYFAKKFRWTVGQLSKTSLLLKMALQATLGFMQVGHNIVTSTNCKSQLQFRQTNYYQLLYITSSTYFQSAAAMGRRNTNSQPA